MKTITKKIIAIGGGEIMDHETLSIDKRIIELTGKRHPKILFIPTAKSDEEAYCNDFAQYFGEELGCNVSFLKLCESPPSYAEIQKSIMTVDAIYIGGGNTLKMMKLWRRFGVDRMLKKAWEGGIVLSGISAGAICWFEGGHSDSMSFYHPEKWDYINVRGLGFFKGILCPHYNSGTFGVPRKKWFEIMMKKHRNVGLGVDEGAAIEFIDECYRIIKSKPDRGVYRVFKKNRKVISEKIKETSEYIPYETLFN